jgi:hypothetical protein
MCSSCRLRDYFAAKPGARCSMTSREMCSRRGQQLDPELHRHFEGGRLRAVAETILGDASAIDGALAGLLTPQALSRFGRERGDPRAHRRGSGTPRRRAESVASFFTFTRMRREVALAPCAP